MLKNYVIVDLFTILCWILLWGGNSVLAHYISTKISWLKFPVKRFVVGLVTTIAYTAGSVSLLMFGFEKAFNFNFGGFAWTVYFSIIITMIISLFLHGREFLMSWRQAAIDKERLERENITAKFESLKSQVNPHFLFNSLNALTNLVYEDPDKAAKFIKQLSDVYRYVLDARNRELVPVDEELKFIKAYLYLEKIRFGDKLDVDITLGETTFHVAPLALQMLVENAIKHNEISETHPLVIRIYKEGSYVVVTNALKRRMQTPADSAGVGLENIRHRYGFLSDVEVVTLETNGNFTVKLPAIELTER
ncbi:MAG: histidine kinase [Bacteroidia bacterium]|nr:histidine kinase [Bacteroidia bacterium]